MYSVQDKVLFLKSVNIFSETPDESLVKIAEIVDEVFHPAGHALFEKGEMGTCMYIIADGRVRVHDGERTLNFLGKHEIVGEMAVLDPTPQPRSASVTVADDAHLFQLDQDTFYGLLSTHFEIVTGVIGVLCNHLRARLSDMNTDFRYIQQVQRITAAAAAIEQGVYNPESIDEVTQRTDALGQLARVFQRMAREVHAREQRLQQQVMELRIEIDQVKKEREVTEITESDHFKELRERIREMRNQGAKE